MGKQKRVKRLKDYKPSKSVGGKSKKPRIPIEDAHKPLPNNLNNKQAALNFDYQNLGLAEEIKEWVDPVDVYNEESQYKRYEKGMLLAPIKEEESQGETEYHTNHQYYFDAYGKSTQGNWIVSVIEKHHFVQLEKQLTLLCGGEFSLSSDDISTNIDDDDIVWEQISGNKTVTILNSSAYPTFKIEKNCYTVGCQDANDRNIILKVYPKGEEYLFDYLVIYTVPHSSLYSPHLVQSYRWNPLQDIGSLLFIPISLQRAFQWTSGSLPIYWFNSSTFTSSPYRGSFILSNITGEYLPISSLITSNQFDIFFGQSYKILSYYEDALDPTISRRIYFLPPSQNLSYYFGNDSLIGANIGISLGKSPFQQLNLLAQRFDEIDPDTVEKGINHNVHTGKQYDHHYHITVQSIIVIDISPISITAVPVYRSIVSSEDRNTILDERRRLVQQEIVVVNTTTRIVSTVFTGQMFHVFVNQDGNIIG